MALFAGGALGLSPVLAEASEAESVQAASSVPSQEWIGVELTPASVALSSAPCCEADASLSRAAVGFGGGLRALQHRWTHAYLIPLQVDLYVSGTGSHTYLGDARVEGGAIIPGTDRRLQVGLGAGVGFLVMTYATHCDGSCNLGGAGVVLSPAARYTFLSWSRLAMGASLRALIPLQRPSGEFFGFYRGDGRMLVGAIDLAFGRP